jgi:two-component sensor histidine kinase
LGSLNVMATVLKDSGNYAEAERIYKEAIALALETNNNYQLEPLYNNLAYNYNIQNKPELALTYYQKALTINEQLQDNSGIAIAKGNIANALFDLERYAEAKTYLEEALAIRQAMGAEEDVVGYRGRLGALNIHLGQRELGLQQLEENLQIAQEKGYKNEILSILDYLVKSTRQNGMYEVSAHYAQELINQIQKRNAEVLEARVNELNAKYKKAEQDQEIAMLSATNDLQQARLSRQRILLYGGGLVLLIFGGLLFAIYQLYRQLNHRNAALNKALSQKETLLKEIHHRVKNNLQVISSLLNLQTFTVKDEAALEALRESRARVQSMSLIHQSLYRKDKLTGVHVPEYLQQLCESLLATYQVKPQHIQLRTDIAPITLDVDSLVPLGLIINELLTNSLKYAFPNGQGGQIDIRIAENEEGLELTVQDNGVGIANPDQIQNGESFGYELIQAFQQKLDAELAIDSTHGTRVSLLIRNYQKAA